MLCQRCGGEMAPDWDVLVGVWQVCKRCGLKTKPTYGGLDMAV